jgi:hypothetical protein
MAEQKTKPTRGSVEKFLASIPDERRRKDALTVCKLMRKLTGQRPKMWGASMVGFGEYHYRYPSGHEGDSFQLGFSPRKQALTLYVMPGLTGLEKQLARLGKHKMGKGCLYVGDLAQIDLGVLEKILASSLRTMRARQASR